MDDIFSTERLTEELLKIENQLTRIEVILAQMEQIMNKLSSKDDMF